MFFILPIGSEEGVRRLPYVTLGLIVINTIVWIITAIILSSQTRELEDLHKRLLDIELRYTYRIIENDPNLLRTADPDRFHERFAVDSIIPVESYDYEEWRQLYDRYKVARSNLIFEQLGYKPNQFDVVKLITSLFVHANFFHLLFNMLFLWLVGCNIEDDWTWKVFLGLYFMSGIVATMFHSIFYPGSDIPLIGASGAIAGIMGAFMIRHFKTKIRLVYFLWLFIRPYFGVFSVYAGIALPIWFFEQIWAASWSAGLKGGGTAYWAHIGGFIFGAVVGMLMKYMGLEKKYIEPVIEESFEKLKLSPNMKEANQKLETGDTAGAIPLLLRVVAEEPRNVDALLTLVHIYIEKGQINDAQVMYDKALGVALMTDDAELTKMIYDELKEKNLLERISENNLYRLGSFLEKLSKFEEAVKIYELYINNFNQAKLRSKAIYRIHVLCRDKLNNEEKAKSMLAVLHNEYPDWLAKM